ncbi:hypothetical protein LFM09_10840 [Lentzea alba]|uniref:hypothetical protein n=1 Tax=Lentzea alba TaxID=2714351 RepID=UPI0039BFE1D9
MNPGLPPVDGTGRDLNTPPRRDQPDAGRTAAVPNLRPTRVLTWTAKEVAW